MPTTPLGTRLTSTRVRAGKSAADAAGVEVLVGGAPVVAGGQRDVERLVEGVLAGLARLPDDQVDDLLLAVEHEVVQPQERRGPHVDRRTGPLLLGASRAAERLVDVRLGRLRDVRERLVAERRADLGGPAGGGDHPAGEGRDVAAVEGVGRGGVVLGVVGTLDDRPGGGVLGAHVPRVCRLPSPCYPSVTLRTPGRVGGREVLVVLPRRPGAAPRPADPGEGSDHRPAAVTTPGGGCPSADRSTEPKRAPARGATDVPLRSGFRTGLMSMAAPNACADQARLPATRRQL